MTTPKPVTDESRIDINLRGGYLDQQKLNAFLVDIFGLWEKGKTATEQGFSAAPAEWKQIVDRTCQLCTEVAVLAIQDVSGPLAQAVSKATGTASFAEGVKHGQRLATSRKQPGDKPALVTPAPQAIDNPAILKAIGEEMRRMFETGLAQGQSTAKQAGDTEPVAVKLEKPSGEVVRVQRNAAGDIVGAVKEFLYENRQDSSQGT